MVRRFRTNHHRPNAIALAGDGRALASLLANLAAEPKRLAALQTTIAAPVSLASTVGATIALYAALPERAKSAASA